MMGKISKKNENNKEGNGKENSKGPIEELDKK